LVGDKPLDRAARKQVADEPARAHRLLLGVLPATTFYQLFAGIEDGCDPERNLMLVKEFLPSIENAGMSVYPGDAPHFLPTSVLAEHSITVANLWSAPAKYWRNLFFIPRMS
jgi:hypothetical protein